MKNNKVFQLRLSDELKDEFQQAADKDGFSLSDWLRLAGQEKLKGKDVPVKAENVRAKPSATVKNVMTKRVSTSKDVITEQPKVAMTNPDSDFERFKRFRKTPYTQY